MARVKVGGNGGPIFKWESNGQQLEGTFLGLRDGKQFPGQKDRSKLLDLKKSNGEQVSAGAPTALAGKLADVKPGTYVYITYTGKARGQSGVEYKNFDVEIDVPDGQPLPANTQPSTAAPATGVAALESKLRGAKGDQVGNLMIDALKTKHPKADDYERELVSVLKSNGVLV